MYYEGVVWFIKFAGGFPGELGAKIRAKGYII